MSPSRWSRAERSRVRRPAAGPHRVPSSLPRKFPRAGKMRAPSVRVPAIRCGDTRSPEGYMMAREGVARFVHRLADPTGYDLATDRELLEWFAEGRNERAFEALIRRHGRLVWSAASRV